MATLLSTMFINLPVLAQEQGKSLMMFNFEAGFDLESVDKRDAEIELIGDSENRRLQINTGHNISNPGITLRSPEGGWDLNTYHQVKIDVTNTGDHPMQLILQVGNPKDGMEAWQMQIAFDLEPGESKTVVDNITTTPWVFSSPLELVGMRAAPGQAKTDLSSIDRIILTVRYADKDHKVVIDNIRAEGLVDYVDPEGFLPFIDKYGQFKHDEWPGKIQSEDDLRLRKEEEEKDLLANPGPSDFNKYGGWKAGPRFEATGYFRAKKYKGVWWLVDPEGYLFWSHGACCVHPGSATTGITDREAYYEELPARESPLGRFYGGSRGASHGHYKGKGKRTTYNFTGANLYYKYGKDWKKEFNRLAHAHLCYRIR